MARIGFADHGKSLGEVRHGTRIILACSHDVSESFKRTHVLRILVDELYENGFSLIAFVERIEIERLANIDGALQRCALRDLVVRCNRIVVPLHGFLSVGERGKSKGMVGLRIEGELQVDRSEADAPFSGKCLTEAIEYF